MSYLRVAEFCHFIPAMAGGLLIGLSASLYLLVLGRVAGISGLAASAAGISSAGSPAQARAFLVVLVAGSAIAFRISGVGDIAVTTSYSVLVVAGAIVGFGTRLGGGCTSGHGVCGIARGSCRSILATIVFIATGMATVFIARHLLATSR